MVDAVATNQAEEEQAEAYDTSDQVSVNKARKKSARTRADRLEFVKASMSFPQGRSWFYDQLVFCHIFQNPFVAGGEDGSRATDFKLGELNAGLRMLDDIQTAAPNDYLTMIQENKNTKNG